MTSTSGSPEVETPNVNYRDITKDHPRDRSTLESSLWGVNLPGSQCYLFINGYLTIDELALRKESIVVDLKKLGVWMGLLSPRPDVWQYSDSYKGGTRRAEDGKIRKILGATRYRPTLIYISGHTETLSQPSHGQLAYIPADHLPTAPKHIPYETMRQLLLKNPNSAPLLFITEVCYCDNFLRLPYMLVCEGDEVQWQETEYPDTFSEGSSIVVHFAATSPNERAISFENGCVFTKAFYNVDPRKEMSLGAIAKRLQENVNTILVGDTTRTHTQHPKVYCSQKTDDPHFFKALGFYSPQDSDSSSIGGDSDSNA